MALGLTLGKQVLAAKNRLIPMMDKSAWAQEIKGDVSPPKGGEPPANVATPKPLWPPRHPPWWTPPGS